MPHTIEIAFGPGDKVLIGEKKGVVQTVQLPGGDRQIFYVAVVGADGFPEGSSWFEQSQLAPAPEPEPEPE